MVISTKDGGKSNQIRPEKQEKQLDSRIEIPNVCMEWANFSTQAAVYFDIKFTNYEVDVKDVKEAVRHEMEVVSYLIYKVQITFQQGCEQWKTPTD